MIIQLSSQLFLSLPKIYKSKREKREFIYVFLHNMFLVFHKSLPTTRRCRPSEEETSSNTKYCRRRERTICKTATLPTLQRTRHTREPHSRHVTANIIAKHKRRHSLHSKTKHKQERRQSTRTNGKRRKRKTTFWWRK
jgi:hypothetical protein